MTSKESHSAKQLGADAHRGTFSGGLGFVLAAAGSAVGLGNIWRFPYLAARDGGGLFLCIYVVLALTFGFTLLITEVAMGRRSKQGPLTAYGYFNRKWAFLGVLSFIIPFIIFHYYCVIGGWVLKYLSVYLTFDGSSAEQEGYFGSFVSDSWQPMLCLALFSLMTYYVVSRGVEKGIERFSRIVMPALLFLVVFIALYGLTLSHTDANGVTRTGLEGALVYLIPNFDGLTLKRFLMIALDATGQLFYSLSIAMGIMVAYGSYMKRNVNLGQAVDRIEMCDTVIALLAGLMIIPAVYVFSGTEGMSAGPGLMFVSLPRVFGSLGFMGDLLGLAFFLLVLFAALTSAVSILEACVSGVMDKFQWQRKKAVRIITAWGMLLAIVVNLGYNVLYFEYELPNGAVGQILDIFDYVSNNVLMPFLAICTCILIGWVTRPDLLVGEMRLNGYHFWRKPVYVVMLKYIVPVLLVILLLGAFEIY